MKLPEHFSLKTSVNILEDGIITLSGPALAISGIIAGVDLLTGGHVLQQVSWLALAWAICLLLTLDFQVLALGARAHQVYLSDKSGRRKAVEIILAFAIASAISMVSIQMQSIIARVNGAGLTIDQAAAQLGINTIWLIWERSALVLVLIFMSGWFREEKHSGAGVSERNTSSISDETVQLILSRLAKLDTLEQQLATVASQRITVVSEQETLLEIPETTSEAKEERIGPLHEPRALLPVVSGVGPEDVKSVLDAYLSGIAKRDICTHLHWGATKYSTIVKPVLDQWETQKQSETQSA